MRLKLNSGNFCLTKCRKGVCKLMSNRYFLDPVSITPCHKYIIHAYIKLQYEHLREIKAKSSQVK